MPLFGYARVSTRDQDLAAQDAELRAAGCASEGQRLIKLRSVVTLPGLDLGKFGDWRHRSQVGPDRSLLCLQPKP
jgi:DNA invertase Pin-like site-specific DNA recombinase